MRLAFLSVSLLLACGGCVASMHPLSTEQRAETAARNVQALARFQTPPQKPMTLADCMARTIHANLDYRAARMEQMLGEEEFSLARLEMLPDADLGVGHNFRHPESASSSQSIKTRQESLEASTSQDMSRHLADLTFSWNILDFGVSYYKAKQQADEALVKREARRKALQTLVQRVRAAWWKAASAQVFANRTQEMLGDAAAALEKARALETERVASPLNALQYQRALLELINQLELLKNDFVLAREELLQLVNLPPSFPLALDVPEDAAFKVPAVPPDLASLESMALDQRPELREENYKQRISALDVRKTILQALPGVAVRESVNYDSNSFLVDNVWQEFTIRAAGKLFELMTLPKRHRLAKDRVALAEMRQLAMHASVLSQVHISSKQYALLCEVFDRGRQLNDVELRIARMKSGQTAADVLGGLEAMRSKAQVLFAQLDNWRVHAELQNAYGRLLVSVGVDVLPPALQDQAPEAMAAAIADRLKAIEGGQFPVDNATDVPARAVAPASSSREAPDMQAMVMASPR